MDTPLFSMVFHHVWPWFSPRERFVLAQQHPALHAYVSFRYQANQRSVATLQQAQRNPPPALGLFDSK
jgi:hypothetical protein